MEEKITEKIEIINLFKDFNVPCGTQEKMMVNFSKYVELLIKWSAIHNVFSRKLLIGDLWCNIYDSLAFILLVRNKIILEKFMDYGVLDAGSGGGFPGIPLAIFFTQKKFLLVEANRKKCSFLRLVKARLNLDNVLIVNERLEQLDGSNMIVTKAAFSPKNVEVLSGVLNQHARLIMWSAPHGEINFVNALLKHNVFLTDHVDYDLPHDKKRRLLVFVKA